MALTTACVAQSYTTYSVVTSSNADSASAGWYPLNTYSVDVNNDGIPDLIEDGYFSSATGGWSEQPVFGIRIANGDGTFKPAVHYNFPPGVIQAASVPPPLAFGDFNGDGRIDIATSAGGRTVAVYLGKGDGTFVSPWYSVVPIAAGQVIQDASFVAADFNHDGKLDLAIVGTDTGSDTVYVLQGEGNGLFSTAQPVLTVPGSGKDVAGWGVQRMLLGDFDGDHNADLAVVATTGNDIGAFATVTTHVLYGNGNLTFDDTTPVTSGNVAIMNSGDLNSDGRSDLFALDPESFRLNTYYGQADRTFASYTQQLPPAPYIGSQYGAAPAMADFNNDGRNDLVTATQSPSGLVYLIFFLATSSPGQFELQTWNIPSAKGVGTTPIVGDFNHDGKPDWVFNGDSFPAQSILFTGLNGTAGGLWSDCAYPGTARGINMCSPAGWSNGTVNFNAAAHSFGQLRKIELWVDGKKLDEQYNTWESNAWLNFSSTLAPGTHKGAFVAADVDNTLQEFPFLFVVPSNCSAPSAPGVHICDPTNGSTTSGNPDFVIATANITGTLARMEVWVDSTKMYTETDSTALSVALNLAPGVHRFTVFAVNTSGTAWQQTVTATVP